jgi:demethylspheroidene O-methyltransferase
VAAALLSRSWWIAYRDQLLGKAQFLRFAIRFPLTRPIARRRAGRLFDLCAGFVYSQILLACVRLRLFELLADGPRRESELADAMLLSIDDAQRLLRAAVSLELVAPRGDDRFGLGVLGSALVANPGVAGMIEHHSLLYSDLADPVALLRRRSDTSLARYWPYAEDRERSSLPDAAIHPYSTLMSQSQALIVDDVLAAYSLAPHRRLLDVGGGDGHFVAAVAKRWPHLEVAVFDLPAVVERARARFANEGINAGAVGGDFATDALPGGADVITLIRVAHDHDDAALLALFRSVRKVLPEDGALVLAEPMSGTRGGERIADAYFGFYLLAMRSGRPRSPEELTELLTQAGFGWVRSVPTRMSNLVRLLVAAPVMRFS